MSKKLLGLIMLLGLAFGGMVGCGGGSDEAPQRDAQLDAQMQKVQEQINANNQAITAIETRLQILEEDFSNNVGKIREEIAKTRQSTQSLSNAMSGVTVSEPQAPAEKTGVLPGWLEFILILVIIVAALLLLLYLLRPKPVEDEDFEDFEDMEDFELDDAGDSGEEKTEDDKKE